MKHIHRTLAVVLACIVGLTATVRAEQNGTGHYMAGEMADFGDAMLGTNGWAALDWFYFYDGGAGATKEFPIAGQRALDVRAVAYANTVGGVYESSIKVLSGNLCGMIAVPYVWTHVTADVKGPVTTVKRTDFADGFGDMYFAPAISWVKGDMKYDFRLGTYAPSGDFDSTSLANPGLGYWTVEPEVTYSYLGSKNGIEVSAFLGYDFNTANHYQNYLGQNVSYQSGEIAHLDITVAQHLPLFKMKYGIIGIGANAFYIQQVTGDAGSGAALGSFKARQLGVGPVLNYVGKFKSVDIIAEVKWLPQLEVENTTKGNAIWAKLIVAF